MSDPRLTDKRHFLSHPPIPYFIGKSFDYLVSCDVPEKNDKVACITSSNRMFLGHEFRRKFLYELQKHVPIDVFGRGICEFKSKWDVLSPYRYAVVLENFIHPWYWSEKISDCFLSWTMPFYVGCDRIHEYFPAAALAHLPLCPVEAARCIALHVEQDRWRSSLAAINDAREKVLSRYGLFPYLASLIKAHELQDTYQDAPQPLTVSPISASILETWVRSRLRANIVNARQRIVNALSSIPAGSANTRKIINGIVNK
jgi:hypothetical protein